MNEPQVIRRLLLETTRWAVVGCSPSPARDSHRIAALLQDEGKQVHPVTPVRGSILGSPTHPTLADLAATVDIEVVDIFRRADKAGAHVDEAIAIGAKAVWLQLGVIDHDAAARAEAAGLDVVMDRCPAIEYPKLR